MTLFMLAADPLECMRVELPLVEGNPSELQLLPPGHFVGLKREKKNLRGYLPLPKSGSKETRDYDVCL